MAKKTKVASKNISEMAVTTQTQTQDQFSSWENFLGEINNINSVLYDKQFEELNKFLGVKDIKEYIVWNQNYYYNCLNSIVEEYSRLAKNLTLCVESK